MDVEEKVRILRRALKLVEEGGVTLREVARLLSRAYVEVAGSFESEPPTLRAAAVQLTGDRSRAARMYGYMLEEIRGLLDMYMDRRVEELPVQYVEALREEIVRELEALGG